jgi:single-strand selective monofunctional uracil DNA glycosylase
MLFFFRLGVISVDITAVTQNRVPDTADGCIIFARQGLRSGQIKISWDALKPSATSKQLIAAARELSRQVEQLKFAPPVSHTYNPLAYAWKAHEEYLRRFGDSRKPVVFLGMNPGPFGMVQTGIPFGEIAAVRDWMKISASINRPAKEHLKRPILGFACPRSEVSGRRFWKLFADRFGSPEKSFAGHFVVNYCPLAFLAVTGANLTPNKLPKAEREKLLAVCDQHLHRVLKILEPEWLIGIGAFARKRGELAAVSTKIHVGQILHPSPASPKANRQDWGKSALHELVTLGVWK